MRFLKACSIFLLIALGVILIPAARADFSFHLFGLKANHTSPSSNPELKLKIAPSSSGKIAGKWQSNALGNAKKDAWLQLEIAEGGSTRSAGRPISELSMDFPKKTGPVDVAVSNEAGELKLSGQQTDTKAEGSFEFHSNPEFLEKIKSFVADSGDEHAAFKMFLAGLSLDYAKKIHELDYTPSIDDLLRLKSFGITPDYISQVNSSGSHFAPVELTKLRSFGVQGDYPGAMKSAGYKFSSEELVKLRSFGVAPEYAAAWKKAGYDLKAEEITKLRSFGVPEDFAPAMKRTSMNLTVDEIVKLRSFSVPPDFIAQLQSAGYNFTVEEIVKLRSFSVPADYAATWKKAGYDLKAEDLTKLRSNGVPVEFASAARVEGRKPLDVDTIVKLRSRGLSADEVRKLRE